MPPRQSPKPKPTPSEKLELGTLEVKTNDTYEFQCDSLAVARQTGGGNCLCLLSVVGSQTAIKVLSAVLNSNAKATIQADTPTIRTYLPIDKHPQGYRFYRHRLSYGRWHMLGIAREPRLIPHYSHKSLWQLLRGPQYTTPILPWWIPWIAERLSGPLLVVPPSFQCSPAILLADDSDIDEIVIEGRDSGALSFERPKNQCYLTS